MRAYSRAYRCSACGALVEVDDVREHVAAHQAARDFSGYIGFEREDKPTTPLEQDPAASSSSSSPAGSTAAAAHDAARPDGEPRS